jgi:hypothetical protein
MTLHGACTDYRGIAMNETQKTTKQSVADAAVAAAPILLNPAQLAERLNVPLSWVREKSRERARIRDRDPLPIVRLGKYVRFDLEAVTQWIGRQAS